MTNYIKRFSGILLIFLFILSSCSSDVTKQTSDEVIIYPPPPDTARIQYLTSFSNSLDITGKQSSLMEYVTGEKKGGYPIIKPYGVIIYNGVIYICDTILGGLEIIDLNKHTFDYFQPKGYGTIKKPINICVDNKGNFYVADAARREVIVFDKNLKYVKSFGNSDELKPTDVIYYEKKLYVANMLGHKIEVYDANSYNHLYDLPDSNYKYKDPGFLNSPTNICIADSFLYVSDFGAFKIKKYTLSGTLVDTIGSYGRGHGQFVRPKGIAVDKKNRLYVVDSGFENVQIFNKSGKLLMFFGGTYQGPGGMWLPAKVTIDYNNLKYFQKYVDARFNLKYLILVSNQYGPDKISVYGYVEYK